ncbi:hypothetical protein CN172_28055 [Sinorhizobium meliloti]|nr:hypothetical protein CN232_08260 [Sinorhizobium meliloti]RVH46278.1 hypothetical protein CN208_07685 [Sinorhizobium meliloti]RVI85626.1 hypothetical protein CN190_16135 [Sinorhizobium meliloti]RVK06804.1 hypothetical protein CN172_28055 [Sinorhizobium meliloti]RVM09646.1 hypothetical protein CN125_13125 [Sinorhizobium meliloti]
MDDPDQRRTLRMIFAVRVKISASSNCEAFCVSYDRSPISDIAAASSRTMNWRNRSRHPAALPSAHKEHSPCPISGRR